MTNPDSPTSRPRQPERHHDISRVRRLQLAQVGVILVMFLAAIGVTVLAFRLGSDAADDQRRSAAFFAKLTEVRDRGRLVEVEYWREKERTGRVSPQVAVEIATLGDDLRELQTLFEAAPLTPKLEQAVATALDQLDLIGTDAWGYHTAETDAERRFHEANALKRVTALAGAFDTMAAEQVASANSGAAELERATRVLTIRAMIGVTLLMMLALVVRWMVERTRKRLLEVIASANREQSALREVAELVASETMEDGVLSRLADRVAEVLEGDAGWLVRPDESGSRIIGASMDAPETVDAVIRATDGGHDDPLGVHTAIQNDAPVRSGPGPAGVACSVAAPVYVNGEVWGALVVTADRELPDGSEERLVAFTRLAGLALSNARAHAALARRATRDALTGLPNHGVFHDALATATVESRRHSTPLAVAVLDLDNFKEVNDSHGHHVGDRVLVEVAERLLAEAGPDEMVARIGGEEFAWILPGADAEQAHAAAERARQAVAAAPVAQIEHLTISVGVCSMEDAKDRNDIFQLADTALLAAKNAGRNITVRYTAELQLDEAGDARQQYAERARTLGALRALARAVDARDPATQRHSERVADLTYRVALAAGWTERGARQLREAALVHDVGKIGVPDSVLSKPGRLTDAEFAQVTEHAALGATIVSEAFTGEQVAWVRHHHERIDGGGYPDGLSGDTIPEGARLLAVADSWDAMTTDRSYRAALTEEEAIDELRRVSGTQLDAEAVAIAIDIIGAGSATPVTAPGDELEHAG